MKEFYIFADALEFIESELCSDITQQDIANACCCSLSNLQKVWRYCTHTSIKQYISKRRLANSAKEILRGELTITEIAFMYQYNSCEVFTRAFTRMWGVAPSKFKDTWKSANLYPRFVSDDCNVGGKHMRRKIDLTELYDFLKAKKDTYVLCFDLSHLTYINENYGSKGGDAAILEMFKRIDEAAEEDMAVFRIGGDEFAMITGLADSEKVKLLADKVISRNGEPIVFEGAEIPVSVRTGATRYQAKPLRYNELFGQLQETIDKAVNTDRVEFAE